MFLHIPVQIEFTHLKYHENLRYSILLGIEGKGGGFIGSLLSIMLLKFGLIMVLKLFVLHLYNRDYLFV